MKPLIYVAGFVDDFASRYKNRHKKKSKKKIPWLPRNAEINQMHGNCNETAGR